MIVFQEFFPTRLLALLVFGIAFLSAFGQKKNADSPALKDETHEQWLESLPQKTRDSIIYHEWKQAVQDQEEKDALNAKVKIDEALTHPELTSLDLSYYPNAELDSRITSLSKLERIDLTKARKLDLKKLFVLLSQLPALHYLNLSDGNYSALPSNIGNLTGLDTFIFRNSNIKTVPEAFSKLQNLSLLNMQHNAYLFDDELYDKLRQMNVKSLSLSACGLSTINAKIGEVRSLVSLDLSINDIKNLPSSFGQLIKLEALDLSQNTNMDLAAICLTLTHLPALHNLMLDQCYLATLPPEIGNLISLRRISANANVLTSIPSSMGELSNLEELYIGSPKNSFRVNALKALPQGFGKLRNLKVLYLAGNQLSELCSDFDKLAALEVLDLSRNELLEFPIAAIALTNLHSLDLSLNKISQLPAAIGTLLKLDSLKLDGDFFNKPDRKIKVIPQEICQLKNLKTLSLGDNVVEHLPDCVGGLGQLRSLNMRGNLLATVPVSLAQLPLLEALDLKGNELKAFPEGLGRNGHLRVLNISMNPDANYSVIIPVLAKIKSLKFLDISYNNINREQAQPLIEGLPDCRILNYDYAKH